MNYQTLGYEFGRAMCDRNLDPLFYLSHSEFLWINSEYVSREIEADIKDGAQDAVLDMPREKRAENLLNVLRAKLDLDKASETPVDPDGWAFEMGITSQISPNRYKLLKIHESELSAAEFLRGQSIGKVIREAWSSALTAAQ